MKASTAVIVGRFQVPELHQGHRDLIEFALDECTEVLIVLGSPRSNPTKRNPISAALRASIIHRLYPAIRVAELYDHRSDEVWSQQLDQLVEMMCPGRNVTMYGSRDSFLGSYSGKYETRAFEPKNDCNGTSQRVLLSSQVAASREFLSGVVQAQMDRRPAVYPTVDVAVYDEDLSRVILAGKSVDEGKLRFIGGFVDPTDASVELAAKRETYEETGGMAVDGYQIIGTIWIDDWRYRGSGDTIMTTFFAAQRIYGTLLTPQDDVDLLKWVENDRLMHSLVNEHKPLGEMYLKWVEKQQQLQGGESHE